MHRPRLPALALVALLPAATAAGQELRETLPNGLRVMLRAAPTADRVALVVLYDVGDRQDPQGRSGLAHLIEHCYATAAAGETGARDVRGYLARYPLGWNAQTGDAYTVIAVVVKSDRLDAELVDAAARMRELRVTRQDLDRERPRMHHELANMYGGIPALAARNHARMAALPPPPGARKGGVESQIDAITLQEVRDRLERYYKPRNAILVAVGGFEAGPTLDRIKALFGEIPGGEPAPTPRDAPTARRDDTVRVRVPKPRSGDARGHAAIAYPVPAPRDRDFAAFVVSSAAISAAVMKDRGRVGESNAPSYAWTPIDDPAVAIVAAPATVAEDPVAHLRALVADGSAARGRIAALRHQARMFHGFILGLTPLPDAWIARGNIYGAAFGMARRAQLGIDPQTLNAAIDAVTTDDLRRVAKTVFGPDRGAAAVVEVEDR